MPIQALQTHRLILREWRHSDRAAFAAMNSDSRVMEFFSQPLSKTKSNAFADRIDQHFTSHGFGLYAVELSTTHVFIGYVGLSVPNFTAHFTPCVEIGWRLGAEYWGQGHATEAARAIVNHGFGVLELESIVSFTVPHNVRSRRVMEKIGMTHDALENFHHPEVPAGHSLQRHVLYRLRSEEWKKAQPR